MKIKLKKYKITTSIINQTLRGNYRLYYDYKGYDILGWCSVKNLRYFVLQNKESKQLLKLFYIRYKEDLTFEKKRIQLPDGNSWKFVELYNLEGYATNFLNIFNVYTQKEEESDEFAFEIYEKVKLFILKANQIGQFYL